MRYVRVVSMAFVAVSMAIGATGCKPNSDNNPAAVPAQVCNTPVPAPYGSPYGQPPPTCANYNPGAYGAGGCPPGYMPTQAPGGITCVQGGFFQTYYGTASLYGYYVNPLAGVGPYQTCDTFNPSSCGMANGLRCIPYNNQRYGICGY